MQCMALSKSNVGVLLNVGFKISRLAHMLVLYLLNVLRLQGDPDYARGQTKWFKDAIEFFQKRADDGETDSDTADSCSRMAEEAMNNKMANAELDRERYIMFCEKVVVHFLPPLPPELSK